MRLHSALTFIFLFVPTALSGPLAERGQPQVPYYNYDLRHAGAYLEETNKGFAFAIATFNLPTPSGQHGYSVFVTLDSTECNSWFTAQITSYVTDGKTTYKAWTQWANEEPYIANLTIAPGDVFRLSLGPTSPTSGYAFLENLSTNETDSRFFNYAVPLCNQIVTWGAAIPDSEIGKPIPFDTVNITHVMAYDPSRKIYDAAGARTVDILHGRTAVTSVTTEGSSIIIKRVDE